MSLIRQKQSQDLSSREENPKFQTFIDPRNTNKSILIFSCVLKL